MEGLHAVGRCVSAPRRQGPQARWGLPLDQSRSVKDVGEVARQARLGRGGGAEKTCTLGGERRDCRAKRTTPLSGDRYGGGVSRVPPPRGQRVKTGRNVRPAHCRCGLSGRGRGLPDPEICATGGCSARLEWEKASLGLQDLGPSRKDWLIVRRTQAITYDVNIPRNALARERRKRWLGTRGRYRWLCAPCSWGARASSFVRRAGDLLDSGRRRRSSTGDNRSRRFLLIRCTQAPRHPLA